MSASFAEHLSLVGRLPLFSRLLGKAMALAYRIAGQDRYDTFRLERVHGLPLLVMPSVFNPKLLRTGEFFASHIKSQPMQPDCEVLDMGTGSGVCALFAARQVRRVVAVDINPAAVRCAAINARLNQLECRIEVRPGDLFDAVPGERFDLILFNPPFVQALPRDDRDRAWCSTDVAERYAAGLGAHLKPGGSALVLLSSFGDCQMYLQQFRAHHLTISVMAQRRFVNEKLTLFRVMPASA